MADTEDQVQDEEGDDAEASRYWDEAVSASEGGTPGPETEAATETEVKEPDSEGVETAPETSESDTQDEGPDSESEGEEEDDPWAKVPEGLRSEYEQYKTKAEKYEHDVRSQRGRLGALQKKYDELSRKLEGKDKGKESEPPVDPGDSIFDFPEWKSFEEDFGDVAKPQKAAMRRLYEVMHSRLQDTNAVSQGVQKKQQDEQYEREAAALEHIRPNWLEYVNQNFEGMQAFADSDPALKVMWDSNFEAITNAKQAKRFFDLYDLEHGVTNGKAEPASQKEATPKSEPRVLNAKRQQQLKSAATVAPRSHPAPGRRSDDLPDPDDESAAWQYFADRATR